MLDKSCHSILQAPIGAPIVVMLDDILHLVLLNLSKSELSISSRVSRTWHALAQPILERRRVLKLYLFDSSDKVPWYEQRGRHQRDLIGTVRLENLRHLSLGRGDFHLGDAAIRNEDYTTIFDVVRAVSANLTTLWFASPLPRIDLTAFKFPPFPQLRRLTFCNGPVSEESDSTMNVLFPYLHESTALTELWLPVLDNLEPLHLPSFLLRTLTLHRVEGILEEAAKEKFTALSYLKKLDWSFQLPPKNFALPTSVVELSLRRSFLFVYHELPPTFF
ncbi:hypothetical protein BT69DRAFT_547592 [Atractiella rhizophila]|nr:hypothetical protein BT69DRAFT_547592 [Atractiella rhizophila]